MNRILIWGNGKSHPNSVYNSKQPKTVQELPSKKEISKVYTKDDAFIYIVEGEVYKEGELAFEKDKKELDQPKQLFREHIKLYKGKVEMKFPVEDLSIGENHIIIRTTNDNVFTWGDNYYGQLGIDNFMINKMLSPQFVRLSNIKQIHAYKNNSFAIDGNSKLWVWGKYEYLGINLKSNLFKPLQILNHYNLTFFKVNDNRIICAVNQNNKDTMKDEIINNKKQDEVDESRQESRMNLPSAKSLNDSKRASTKNLGKKKTKKNQVSELILYALDTLSKNIEEYYNENPIQDGKKICYLSELKKKMLNLRKNLLIDENKMRKLGLEQTWEPIDDIIDEGSKKAENIINIAYNRDLPFYDRVNILNSTLNFILNNKAFYFENQNNDGDETQKEYDNFLNNLDFKDSKEMNFRSINGKIQSLMEINLKYQKIEMLAHKMASHQFLVKSYRYQEVLEALQSITIRDKFSERKLEIIISVFDNIGKDLVKSVNSMKSINKAFEILPQITFSLKNFDYSNDDVMAFDYKNEPELFCYKYIIESTVYIQNLWKTTTEDLLQEKQNKELVSNISKSLERYRELYGLHMYMNTLSLKNIIYEKEDGKVTDFNANIKNKLDSYVLEVDGVISKLENFIQEKYETIQDNHSVADVSNSELENDSKILLFPA